MTQQIEWTIGGISDFATTNAVRVLEIRDDVTAYCAEIPEGVEPREMCSEFAHTYDFGGSDAEVICAASVYRDGGEEWTLDNRFGFACVPFDVQQPGERGFARF